MACRLVDTKPLSEPILSIWPLWINFSEILIRIQAFSIKKMLLKMSSAKWRPSCLGLNVLMIIIREERCGFFPVPLPNHSLDTLRPRQNGRHFADDSFKYIFLNENVSISIKISLRFDPKGPNNNIPAMVQIMAWRRPGDKPLSEPMVVSFPTHICVTRPQWVHYLSTISLRSQPVPLI